MTALLVLGGWVVGDGGAPQAVVPKKCVLVLKRLGTLNKSVGGML